MFFKFQEFDKKDVTKLTVQLSTFLDSKEHFLVQGPFNSFTVLIADTLLYSQILFYSQKLLYS